MNGVSLYTKPQKTVMWESLVHLHLSIIIPRTIQKLLIEFAMHREQAYLIVLIKCPIKTGL